MVRPTFTNQDCDARNGRDARAYASSRIAIHMDVALGSLFFVRSILTDAVIQAVESYGDQWRGTSGFATRMIRLSYDLWLGILQRLFWVHREPVPLLMPGANIAGVP